MMPELRTTREKGPSPFTRLLASEVYDGPTAGLVLGASGQDAYRFCVVAWDAEQDRRVFSLRRLDVVQVQRGIAALERVVPPRWPAWWLQSAEDEAARVAVRGIVSRLLETQHAASFVVVTSDLLSSLDAVREIHDGTVRAEYDRLEKTRRADGYPSDETFEAWVDFVESAGTAA